MSQNERSATKSIAHESSGELKRSSKCGGVCLRADDLNMAKGGDDGEDERLPVRRRQERPPSFHDLESDEDGGLCELPSPAPRLRL